MAFEPGVSGNPSGRPKGSENKVRGETKKLLENLTDALLESVLEDLAAVPPDARLNALCRILEYSFPKKRPVEVADDDAPREILYDETEHPLVSEQKRKHIDALETENAALKIELSYLKKTV